MLYHHDRTLEVAAVPAEAIDPTGAGDTYAAAPLLGLVRGDDPAEAMKLATAAASIVIGAPGGDALNQVGRALSMVASQPGASDATLTKLFSAGR